MHDPSDEARREARDESESKETPLGGSRLLALADESKPYEMQTRDGKWVKFGWYAQTPSEWLGVIEGRVRSVRRYAETEGAKTHLIFGALVDLHLLIDAMEVHLMSTIVPSEWLAPEPPSRRRTIAT